MSDRERSYRVLGLESDASLDEIQEAYRDLKAVWHPDRFTDNFELRKKAEEKQEAVEKAYRFLRDYKASGNQEPKRSVPLLARDEEGGRGPSILDDTFSERKGSSKKWVPVWIGLLGIIAIGSVISLLTWSPVDVETDSESSEQERIVAEVKAARSSTQEQEDAPAFEDGDTVEMDFDPDLGVTQEKRLEGKQESWSPRKPSEKIAAPPAEPRDERLESQASGSQVAASTSHPPTEPASPSAFTKTEESEPSSVEAGQKETVPEEQPRSEVAERAFQILRAKSELANQLVEGGFADFGFRDWKALERGSTEVYVDLLAESVSEGREVHFVWAVDVEAQSVKAMSQAARDLQAEDR